MRYLRKTVTYAVESPEGQRLFVDQFELADPIGEPMPSGETEKLLMLRNGEEVSILDEQTLHRRRTGEKLTILSKE